MMVARWPQYHLLDSQRLGANGAEMLGVQLAGAHPMAMTASPATQVDVRRDQNTPAATSAANCVPAERALDLGQAAPATERRCAGTRGRWIHRRDAGATHGDETGRGREFAGKMPALPDGGVSSWRTGRRLCRIRLGKLANGVSHIRRIAWSVASR
jgi:hypothetical protein